MENFVRVIKQRIDGIKELTIMSWLNLQLKTEDVAYADFRFIYWSMFCCIVP